ncbi:MAG: sigma-54-dependent Fis family transcriptional regulator [Candidatus Tectomicrobia bacterium]|uniref:Sigma-54-dependent Fis family transcriptional regulator n=1 Tax=Tectimicrobiota bacterium TaxID=2528274 RepID=A0A932CND6_UNCTE|nr:sigma-54-dependent Fis family transcriptional regulator [Candidatus Tectomicrobia bacterium]
MEVSQSSILVVEDEANIRKILAAFLRREGHRVTEAADGLAARDCLARDAFQAVITDQKMPRMDGLALLAHCVERYPEIPVILITAHGTIETAVKAMKEGAFDYITKPFEEAELLNVVRKAVGVSAKRRKEPTVAWADLPKYGIVGRSSAMQAVFRLIDKVADSPATVLLAGETGTGKELIARALHGQSARRDKPFIAINCGAIPDNLVESELFGYERGAFTGAVTSKPGRFELSDGGTLFLDEIGELKKEVQVKLLRVLQEQVFERVGGVKTLRMDARLIAATNRDLALEVKEDRFRKDLYYRLNVVAIQVPPLQERVEDIPTLVHYFIERFNRQLGRKVRTVTDEALQALLAYPYPGNIRELENILERAVLLADGETIGLPDLPPELRKVAAPHVPEEADLKGVTTRAERAMIVQALEETEGNVTRAAKRLGMSRRWLQLKMKEYGLRGRETAADPPSTSRKMPKPDQEEIL